MLLRVKNFLDNAEVQLNPERNLSSSTVPFEILMTKIHKTLAVFSSSLR